MCFNSAEAHIVFVHTPKCGGTTLYHLLKANFRESEIYPLGKLRGKYSGQSKTKEDMEEAIQTHPNVDHELIWGHFPIWFLKRKDTQYDKAYIFTVLRDPVERVLSHDRYRYRVDRDEGRKAKFNPLTINPNFTCKMLCSDITLDDDEMLRDCIQNLERMDFIIFMDDYENGVRRLFKDLGLRLPKRIPRREVSNTPELSSLQKISDETIEQVKELNSLDVRLYEYANKYFRKPRY